jgi:hypothetical protein
VDHEGDAPHVLLADRDEVAAEEPTASSGALQPGERKAIDLHRARDRREQLTRARRRLGPSEGNKACTLTDDDGRRQR